MGQCQQQVPLTLTCVCAGDAHCHGAVSTASAPFLNLRRPAVQGTAAVNCLRMLGSEVLEHSLINVRTWEAGWERGGRRRHFCTGVFIPLLHTSVLLPPLP
eukprot:434302-Pelagomonas_calceolata.AAC.1